MRYINKLPSPAAFETWKQQQGLRVTYRQLGLPQHQKIKEILRTQLVNEQKGLCCYCGIALDQNNVHIEHHKPQRNPYKAKQLDYSNLHASCMGKEAHPDSSDELTFCGHSKGSWYDPVLTISPLDPLCESYFKYSADGRIYSTDRHPGGEETICRLGLDTHLLNNLRESAINTLLENINWDDPIDVNSWIDLVTVPDANDKLPSFSQVLLFIINSYHP